jgi:hypothetical protein
MAEQLRISLVERQRCATEFCVRLEKSGSGTLQLIHEASADDATRWAAIFKHSPTPKKFCMNHAVGKVMLILFFYAKGIIL